MKPRTVNIDSFCSKLSQSNLKGLFKMLCEHKCHTKYGSGSRSGHERSPDSKMIFLACGTRFMVTFARRIQKSRPFCNLTPGKSATEKSQVNPGSFKVKFSNQHFWTKHVCFWTSLLSRFPKCHDHFCGMTRNAQNRSCKNWRKKCKKRMRFCAICLPKIDISTWNLACYMPRHGSRTYCTVFWKMNMLDFEKWYEKLQFLFIGRCIFFLKSEIAILKNFVFCTIWCFSFCFKYLFLGTFQTFSNIRPKMAWHWVT